MPQVLDNKILRSGPLPIKLSRTSGETLQAQLFRYMQALIVNGHLKPGTAIPSFRELAAQLGVSKNTVILTYEQLVSEGYLVTRSGVGTFVSPHLPEQAMLISQRTMTRQEKNDLLSRRHPLLFHGSLHKIFARKGQNVPIDFVVGRPAAETFPSRLWKRLMVQHIDHDSDGMTQYKDPAGMLELREAIAGRIGPARGINVSADQIIITGGIQEALSLIGRLLVASETTVAIESPCYQGAEYVFRAARAEIVPVPVDKAGLVVEELPTRPVSVIYVTPSHQYPLGGTLSLERRFKLLEWAWESGAYIIEDDYDSDFCYRGSPLLSLAGLDRHESVIYLGTFSKSIGAGIRTGYIVAPKALVEPLTTLKGLLNNGNPWLEQAVLKEFLASGGFDRHVRKTRQLYLNRQSVLVDAIKNEFGAANVRGTAGGMHLVWTLPEGIMSSRELAEKALEEGIGIYPLDLGAASLIGDNEDYSRMVMLGFPCVNEDDIRKGVKILGRIAKPG